MNSRLRNVQLLAGFLLALTLLLVGSHALAVDSAAREVLSDERYRFCHEGEYPMFPGERRWCDLVGDESQVCPKLPASCEANIEPKLSDFAWGGGSGDGRRVAPPGDDSRQAKKKKWEFSLPEGLSQLATFLFFVLLAVGVAALIYVIAKNSMKGDDDLPPEIDEPVDEVDDRAAAARRIVETDVDRLLRRAREAADRGEYDQAIDDAYAAVLRRLEGDGLIDMHESQTNGDYVRSLRQRPDLMRYLREVVRDVERVQFGTTNADASLFEATWARVMPLVGRVAALVLLVASSLLVSGCPESGGSGPSIARAGTSPSGTRGIIEMLDKHRIKASYRLEPLSTIDDTVGALIVLPGGIPEEFNWEPLVAWMKEGGTLILAGTTPPADIANVTLASDPVTDPLLVAAGEYEYLLSGIEIRTPPSLALRITDASAAPSKGATASLLATESMLTRDPWDAGAVHYATRTPYGQGELLVFADHLLFTNIALTVDGNSEALLRMLDYRGDVQISDPWTGAGSSSPLESIHRARMTPIVVQLLFLLLLFLLWRGISFGRMRDKERRTRRSFGDHVRAVGLQYARAKAANHAFGAYASWALERLRERVPKGRQRSIDELADELAARSGMPASEVSRLLHAAQAASDAAIPASFRPDSLRGAEAAYLSSGSPGEHHLEVMRKLSDLLANVSRARSVAQGSS
jgi:hypothetical protein